MTANCPPRWSPASASNLISLSYLRLLLSPFGAILTTFVLRSGLFWLDDIPKDQFIAHECLVTLPCDRRHKEIARSRYCKSVLWCVVQERSQHDEVKSQAFQPRLLRRKGSTKAGHIALQSDIGPRHALPAATVNTNQTGYQYFTNLSRQWWTSESYPFAEPQTRCLVRRLRWLTRNCRF